MTSKRTFVLAALCGLAAIGAGCGDDDNDTLSYDDTGTEISAICDKVQFEGLNGDPENDAPILEEQVPNFEDAVQEVADLEVNEELEAARDDFVANGEEQVAIIKEAQAAAEAGDKKGYRAKIEEAEPLDAQSDEFASQLGATGCAED
jgi:hypothetical protein